MATVAALLQREDVAVLTVTGPGGAGKTRVAREVASHMRDCFPDGVVFVDLSPLSNRAMVECQIAQELDVAEVPNRDLMDLVGLHLRERALLLVVDEFEHVLDAAPAIEQLVQECPGLKVLATSRAPLGLSVERQFPLAPLATPPLSDGPKDEALVEYVASFGAVALFCERAEAVNPGFKLTAENARVVSDICRRLDGLPLALELAATWTKLLSPEQLNERLDRRLTLLTGSGRGGPRRHQTLRDAIDWSYGLLRPEEQHVFRRLSVFAGAATLDAVAAVCASPGTSADDVLPIVASLVNQSLLVAGPDGSGETRVRMLETIREYAREQLKASDDRVHPERALVDYCLELAEEAAPHLVMQDRRRWLRRLADEEDNIRAALQLCLRHDWAEPAMRILTATFWSEVNHAREASSWLASVLASPSAAPRSAARAAALHTAALFRWQQGDFEGMRPYADEAIELAREFDDKSLLALALASSACYESSAERREERFQQAFAAARACGDPLVLERCYRSAASIAQWLRTPNRAIELAGEGMAIGDPRNTWHRGRLQAIRAQARLQLGEIGPARLEMRAAVASFRETHETWTLLPLLIHLGTAAGLDGEWEEARAAFLEACESALAGSEMRSLGHALDGLGVWLSRAGKPAEAREAFAAATQAAAIPGFPLVVPSSWQELVQSNRESVYEHEPIPELASLNEAVRRSIEAARRASAQDPPGGRTATNPAGLTSREIEVLRLIALGHSNKEIADHLFLSVRTVEKHVANIYGKAQINGRAEATLLATRMGLVE